MLYISSRYDGIVYQVTPNGNMSVYVEGMGVATGIAFDAKQNLYVGDRSGTIFKISPDRQIYVFATLEAVHRRLPPGVRPRRLPVRDRSHHLQLRFGLPHLPRRRSGDFYRGLGRPQGMAFDDEGRLYVAASLAAGEAWSASTPRTAAELFLSGPGIVGLAFTPSRAMVVATTNALYRVDVGIKGCLLFMMNAEIIAVGCEMLAAPRSTPTRSTSPRS